MFLWSAAQVQLEAGGQLVLSSSRVVSRGTPGLVRSLQAVWINAVLCCWTQLLGKFVVLARQTREHRHCHLWIQCLDSPPVTSRSTKCTQEEPREGFCLNWSWQQTTLEPGECTVEQEPLLTTLTSHGSTSPSSPLHSSAVDVCAQPSSGGHLQQKHSFSLCWQGKVQRSISLGTKSRKLVSSQGLRDTLIQHILCENHTKEIPFFMISFERRGLQGRQQGTSTSRSAILRSSRLLLV